MAPASNAAMPALPLPQAPAAAAGTARGPAPTPASSDAAEQRLQRLRARPRRPGEATFFFRDAHFNNAAVKVLPGEYFVCDEDVLVMTTLGSCIAACIWDRDRRIGGMNHFLLPEAGSGGGMQGTDTGRYGAFAMDLLIGELVKRGAQRGSMEAKVFGGGAVISGMTSINVGQQNTDFVLQYLRTERITVVSKDVLDIYPRKVCFLPASGKALVKRLASANVEALAAQERAAARQTVPAASAGGTVDLF